jgi:hypothetical protein
MSNPVQQALKVPGIQGASFFTNRLGETAGTVYDAAHGIEYDVRRVGLRWKVNDDDGRDFYGFTLRAALQRAVEAQS